MERHLINGEGFWEAGVGQGLGIPGPKHGIGQQDWGRGGTGPEAGVAGGWVVAMLTSGVPVGFSPISRCLHPRYKGLHRRNLPVHSFCPGCSVHSRARERRSQVRTHTDTIRWGIPAHSYVLTDTPEHGFGPVRTTLEAISTEDRQS